MADQISELSSGDQYHVEPYDTMEDEHVSSELQFSEEDDSRVADSHPMPETHAKRKASPDCIEGIPSQKKIKQTEDESQDLTESSVATAAVTEKSQEALSPAQKNYLVKKLATLQGRKFAESFVSTATLIPEDTITCPVPIDLNKMMAKLLEDKYLSAAAFQDDVQLAVQDPTSGNGKKLQDHVMKFMEKLPKSQRHKRKADESAGNNSAALVTRTLHPGQSELQRRETEYAQKQVKAYRDGTHSNKGKKLRNLVLEKARYLAAEKRKKEAKLAEKTRRLETSTRLMKKSLQTGRMDTDGGVETEKAKETETSGAEKADGDSVDSCMEYREGEKANEDLADDIAEEHEDEEAQEDLAVREVDEAADKDDEENEKNHTSLKVIEGVGSNSTIARLLDISSYEENLLKLSKDLPTQQQIDELDRAAHRGPNFIGRTASTIRGLKFGRHHKKTNGYTTGDVLLPAADSRNRSYCSHQSLVDLSQGEITYMVGNHLVWKDLISDEFLSYSKDPLFLVVHGLRRYHEDQGNVTIQLLDRRMAKAPDGTPAKFYSALDMYTIFEVPKWTGWGHTDRIKLHPRKFTPEYLTHGPVLTPGTKFKQALVEDLIADGLYEIFPEFEAPKDHKRSGLYTLQVVYRKIGYPPALNPHIDAAGENTSQKDAVNTGAHASAVLEANPSSSSSSSAAAAAAAASSSSSPPPTSSTTGSSVTDTSGALVPAPSSKSATSSSNASKLKPKKAASPIYSYHNCARQKPVTVELLNTVRKVTLNFIDFPEGIDKSTVEPPLHAFICFLTFEKRRPKDPVFLEWIEKRYNGISALPRPNHVFSMLT